MPTLRNLMSTDPLVLEPEMSLREALSQLSAAGVSGAPVVTLGNRLVGVLSTTDILDFQESSPPVPSHRPDQQEFGEWDVAIPWEEEVSEPPSAYFRTMWDDSGADLAERLVDVDRPEWDLLGEHIVAEAMTRRVITLPPDADVADAARLMVGSGIHRIIVTEDESLAGIVSAFDFVRAVAEEKLRASD